MKILQKEGYNSMAYSVGEVGTSCYTTRMVGKNVTNNVPERIFIVGASGSGKSTLAEILSQKYNLPHIDMDDIVYPPPKHEHINEEEFFKQAKILSQKTKWIIEGVFIFGMEPVLKKADKIIWLDVKLSTILWRVFLRYFKRRVEKDNRYSFRDNLKLMRFLVYFHHPKKEYELDSEDKHISRNKTLKIIEPYNDKLLKFKAKKDVNSFLADI